MIDRNSEYPWRSSCRPPIDLVGRLDQRGGQGASLDACEAAFVAETRRHRFGSATRLVFHVGAAQA